VARAITVGLVLLWQLVIPYRHGVDLLHLFITYDADVYIRIACSGYTVITDTPYFPLCLLLIRVIAFGGHEVFAALFIANVAGFFVLLLRALVADEAGEATARRALLYLACFPTALY
jgi:hypothetical protein